MLKTTLETAFKTVKKIVKDFEDNKVFYLASSYSEQSARHDFIDKFFIALGWDINHERDKNPYEQEAKIEPNVNVEGRRKRADYAFYLAPNFRDVVFYAEAKKPSVQIENAGDYFQTIRYGYNSETPFAILTDFEQFHILDCRYAPSTETALDRFVRKYNYEDYLNKNKFAEIYYLFSREAVAGGSIEKRALELPKARGGAVQLGLFKGAYKPIDEALLDELDEYRNALAHAFKNGNPELDHWDLTEIVQRVIDRLVFIRFLEDKLIEPEDIISNFGTKSESVWKDFISACRKLDKVYNGTIYKKHDILDATNFKFDDNVFADICEKLSSQNTPYDFDKIPIHILGSIYERFLGKVITTTAKRATVVEKPEVKKAGGVFYTPVYIVRYIVESIIGKQIEGKTPEEIASMCFADIACGSGSFLIGAYDYLLRYHANYYNENPKKATFKDCVSREGGLYLTLHKKREILVNNIYGVDIDQQAVEVAQLSLYLKLLENETLGTTVIDRRNEEKETVLPYLGDNIQCGNSLIGPEINAVVQLDVFDKEIGHKINIFDWKSRYSSIIKNGGFDAIIGNPPYLNIDDTWGKNDIRLEAIKNIYFKIYNDKSDILFYFLVKALELCKGSVGYIISRAFLEAYKADKLRQFLSSSATISKIIDFRNFRVWKDVGITTCIFEYYSKPTSSKAIIYKLIEDKTPSTNLKGYLENKDVFDKIQVPKDKFTSQPWIFNSDDINDINNKIDSIGVPIGKILIIGQGMQTGLNNVFGQRTKKEIINWRLRKGYYYKRASNSDIQRYTIRNREEYILFIQNVHSFDELPNGVKTHLLANADELKSRAAYKRGDCEWWKFTWPLHEGHYDKIRLLCPYLAGKNRFAIDRDNEYLSLTDTTVLFENEQQENVLYFLGLLNSKLLSFRFKSIGKLKGGGIYEYFWNSISKLPIKRINFENHFEKIKHNNLVSLVENMINLKRKFLSVKSDFDKNSLSMKIESTDRLIDELVYELYGLTAEEIAIVEGSSKEG